MYAQAPVTIDRVVASVNKEPLLLSDWEDSLRFEAFLQGRPPASFTASERKSALDRLVDRDLLLQQMQADYSPTREEVLEHLKSIRSQLKGAETNEAWRQMLASYELSEDDLYTAVRTQLQVMRFVDLRLRPSIRIERSDIESYYRDRLVPDLQKAGVKPEPLSELLPKIRELLVQEQMQTVLEAWLVNLRSQSNVHFADDAIHMQGSSMSSLSPTMKAGQK